MLYWKADMFSCGHTIEYIESICYWDYLDLIKGLVINRRIKSKGYSGKITDTHRVMIENKKKLLSKKKE